MRRITAHYIFPVNKPPLKYGILEVDGNGMITDIIDTGGRLREEFNLEFYPGIILPGFVNSHCHLELSHLYNRIPAGTGISSFVDRVTKERFADADEIKKRIRQRVSQLYKMGTSAVGDIVNTPDTLEAKKSSRIHWHNFVELFGLKPDDAKQIWEKGKALEAEFRKEKLTATISPHAPYSVSQELWKFFNSNPPEILSMHSQESSEENELMTYRKGALNDWMKKRGIQTTSLPDPKKSSLESVLDHLPEVEKLLLVHNTYTRARDVSIAVKKYGRQKVFWVLCPNSNLYIDNSLPEYIISNHEGLQLCLGTDSLASNTSLSLLEEIKTVLERFPETDLQDVISWATINGAKALGIDSKLGSFEEGKIPGVVWVDNISHPGPGLTAKSRSRRLI